MPASIALFIKEALAEDKFGHEFNSRIDERVESMNAAQLQGIYNHFVHTSRTATTEMWRNANKKLIGHVEELMRERVGEVDKARAKVEEENAREEGREKLREMRRVENERMLIAVQENARKQAEEEIRTKEKDRQRAERKELVQINARLDEEKDKYFLYLGVFYGVSSLLIIVVFSLQFVASALNGANGAIIGGWMGLSTMVCGYLVYRKYKTSEIFPKEVTEEELEEMIEEREDEIRDAALQHLKEQKRIFKEAMRQEKIERKERRRKAAEKAAYEAKLMEDLAREQAEAAAEVFGESFSVAGSSIATTSAVGEGKEESKEDDDDGVGSSDDALEDAVGTGNIEVDEGEGKPLLGLPWVAEEGERRLMIEICALKIQLDSLEKLSQVMVLGDPVQAQAAAYFLHLGKAGLEATSEKQFWRGTTGATLDKEGISGSKVASEDAAGAKNEMGHAPLHFTTFNAPSVPQDSIVSMGAKARVRIEISSTLSDGDLERGEAFVSLGLFEFSLNDVMQAWTSSSIAASTQGDLLLTGVLLNEAFDTLGSVEVTLHLHEQKLDEETESRRADAEVEGEGDDESDSPDWNESGWESLDGEEEEEED